MSYFASMNFHYVKAVEIENFSGVAETMNTAYAGTVFKIKHENGDVIEIKVFGENGIPIEIIQVKTQ